MSCYFCGEPEGEWLTLEVHQNAERSTFHLFHTESGREVGIGTWKAGDRVTRRWTICRRGHMHLGDLTSRPPKQSRIDQILERTFQRHSAAAPSTREGAGEMPNVIRLLGSTGGGKSQLVRALRVEVREPASIFNLVGTVLDVRIDRAWTPSEAPRMDDSAQGPTISFDRTARLALTEYLNYITGGEPYGSVDSLIERALADHATEEDVRAWGSVRSPYLLTTLMRREDQERRGVTAIVDLPGELVDQLSTLEPGYQLSRSDLAQLEYTHQFLAAVDPMSLNGVFRALNPAEQSAALRKRSDLSPQVAHELSRKQTLGLLTSIQSINGIAGDLGVVPITVCLTKADVIHRLLCRAPEGDDELSAWSWVWNGREHIRASFLESGAAALLKMASSESMPTRPASRVLEGLDTPNRAEAFARARARAKRVLATFGNPGHFYDLILVGNEVSLRIDDDVEVAVESARDFWFLSTEGYDLQVRDIVCGVLVTALLTTEFGQNEVAHIGDRATRLRFALTCTREFLPGTDPIRAEDDPTAKHPENAGVLQVLANVLQGALW